MNAWVAILGALVASEALAQQPPGTWKNVTSPDMRMSGDWINGAANIVADPARPSDLYANIDWDGTWRSTDYGLTWTKVSTGENGDVQNRGVAVYMGIDKNPNRDPDTSPTIYVSLFQAGCLWKSTNFGVDWVNIWNNNIFAPDGVTNISADVGSDMAGLLVVGTEGPDHLLAYLHSYYSDKGNNGVFESTDGGGKWLVHQSSLFNFQPHSDTLMAYDHETWIVSHGSDIYRTVNGGESWSTAVYEGFPIIGRQFTTLGSRIYAGSDYWGGIYKSPDKGATWSQLNIPGSHMSWVVATPTRLYASGGYESPAHIYVASLQDDGAWVDTGNPPGMIGNGANGPAVIFDGNNYILVAAQAAGGLWRYVEPNTGEVPPAIVDETPPVDDPPVDDPPVDDPADDMIDDPTNDDDSDSPSTDDPSRPSGNRVYGTCASTTPSEHALLGLGACVLLLRSVRRRTRRS